MSTERNVDIKRERRLVRNEAIRQRNKAKALENEHRPRPFMVAVVMNPSHRSMRDG